MAGYNTYEEISFNPADVPWSQECYECHYECTFKQNWNVWL